MRSAPAEQRVCHFGSFTLDEATGLLSQRGAPLTVGRSATALLAALVARPGAPVSKDQLIAAAWPGRVMQESNLSVQIAALRRALAAEPGGADWIETLARRGYRYVGPPVSLQAEAPGGVAGAIEAPATSSASDGPSIAVMPFVDLSGDTDQQYFVDGMTEEVVAGLARVKGLFVIAASSSFALRASGSDSLAAHGRLEVRYRVEGSIRADDRQIRVLARLADATTGALLWTQRFDYPRDRLFELQDEIALSVVGAVEPGLRRAEARRVTRLRTDSLDAYDLVLRTHADVDTGMPDRIARAMPLLERALGRDPHYAPTHAQLAMCHHCLFLRDGLDEHHRSRSIEHARAAIECGQDDARALAFAGFSIGMDGHDRAGAFAAFDASLSISPSSAITRIFGSLIDAWAGNAERAIEWATIGLRLSPFDTWRFAALHALSLAHFQMGRPQEAADAARRATLANPSHSVSFLLLAAALARMSDLSQARAAAREVLRRQPGFRIGRQFEGVDCAASLAAALGTALAATGLPG